MKTLVSKKHIFWKWFCIAGCIILLLFTFVITTSSEEVVIIKTSSHSFEIIDTAGIYIVPPWDTIHKLKKHGYKGFDVQIEWANGQKSDIKGVVAYSVKADTPQTALYQLCLLTQDQLEDLLDRTAKMGLMLGMEKHDENGLKIYLNPGCPGVHIDCLQITYFSNPPEIQQFIIKHKKDIRRQLNNVPIKRSEL